ncbi:MAG: hypothetical protein M3P83_07345 [Actinomycetota bacterium]|nr:hypothetical protein [Actinomycetota bacterium]
MTGSSRLGRAAGVAATAVGVAASSAVGGRLSKRRRVDGRPPYHQEGDAVTPGTLRGPARSVAAEDGLRLHVEVDETAEADGGQGAAVVLVHGYALNLDCWHCQRLALRGRHRLVLYDQRSHGRSPARPPTTAPSTSWAATWQRCSTRSSPRSRWCWSATRWAAWR